MIIIKSKFLQTLLQKMLKYIAITLLNPKFDGLISISQSTLTINNQYAFLWNVLPKISGKFTRRNQFINELKAFGFELVNQNTAFNKQNNTECQEKAQKQLVFKAKCYDFMVSLKKIQEIKRSRIAEKQKLDQKIKNISLKFKKIKEDNSQNIMKQFQIFDEISSLNTINRNILAQNEEVNCLLNEKFQVSSISIKHLTTYQLLYSCVEHQNVLQLSKPKMKSSKNLGRPRNIK